MARTKAKSVSAAELPQKVKKAWLKGKQIVERTDKRGKDGKGRSGQKAEEGDII
jgi:hypothetical protein